MPDPRKAAVVVVLISFAVASAAPTWAANLPPNDPAALSLAADVRTEPAEEPSAAAHEIGAAGDEFVMGVRGRRALESHAESGAAAAPADPERPVDEQRLSAALDAQAKQHSTWSDLSKTTKGWFIAGGIVILLILISAFD
jgi:hypothetical protein